MFFLLVMYALFGLTFIIGRDVMTYMPPMFFIALRMLLAGSILGIYIFVRHKKELRFKKEELPWFIGSIFFHIYCAYVLEYISLQYLSGSRVALFYNLSPFITGLLAYLFFAERLTHKRILGLCIGFAAFIPSMTSEIGLHLPNGPELLLLISITSSCIGWMIMKKLTQTYKHSFLVVNTIAMLGGGLLSLGTSYLFEAWPSVSHILSSETCMRDLFGLIFIANIICYNLYAYLLHRYSPTLISFFGCITPLFAALFGHLWLHESINASFFITVAIAALGLYIFYQEDIRLGYSVKRK